MKAFVIARRNDRPQPQGEAVTYRLDEPLKYSKWECDNDGEFAEIGKSAEFVWVSSSNAFWQGWETYIFHADETGDVINWTELPGSRKERVSPDNLMREIGYEVIDAE